MTSHSQLKLEHIHIHATDLETMGRFLQSAFGARLVRKRATNGFDNWEYELDGLGVFVSKTGQPRRPGHLDHLGFRVTDIVSAIKHLQDNGCVVEEGPVEWREDLTFAYLTGPDGLRIELLQRGWDAGWSPSRGC